MQIWAEPEKSALPICNYSQILYQFLTFTQNLKRSLQIREDTELKNFPLFCPKCHKQTLINAKQLNITKAEVPDAKTQSR